MMMITTTTTVIEVTLMRIRNDNNNKLLSFYTALFHVYHNVAIKKSSQNLLQLERLPADMRFLLALT